MKEQVGQRKRPPKLNLEDSKAVKDECITSPLVLRTPKDIVNDIVIQCVSPGIPTTQMSQQFRDAVHLSKTIEAEQRRIIAERSTRKTSISNSSTPITPGTPQQQQQLLARSGNSSSAVVTPNSALSSSPSPKNNCSSNSLTNNIINSRNSGQSTRRPPPEHLELQPESVNKQPPTIYSAPLYRSSPPNSGRQIILNRMKGTNATTSGLVSVYVSTPKIRNNRITNNNSNNNNNNSSSNNHVRSKSTEQVMLESDDEEEEDNGRDPEDAALSDDEVEQTAIDEEEDGRMTKKQRIEEQQKQQPQDQTANEEKKQRFMRLCSEIWDLLH